MLQVLTQPLSAIFELIRKPRKRSSNNAIGSIPAGAGIVLICLLIAMPSLSAFSEGLYHIVLLYAVVVAALIYFNFDFINIKEVINYRNTDYYKLTRVPFREIINDKGIRGEFLSYLLFKHVKSYHKMLFNTYVPMPNGSFQEIDSIVVCEQGIIIVESKNRNGVFVGEAEGKVWNQYIGRQSHELHSPVEQNQKHRIALDYYLKTNKNLLNHSDKSPYYYPLNSLILFSEGAQFDISGELPAYVTIVNRKEAYDYIKYILNYSKHKEFSADEIDQIYNELVPLSTLSEQEKTAKMQYRERMSVLGNYKRHDYKYYEYVRCSELDNFIQWNNENGNIIRYDGVYSELYIEKHNMWVAIPNIDFKYAVEISLANE